MTSHLDPDRLALLALGELPDHAGEDAEHLAGCETCSTELAELRTVVTTARSEPGPVELVEPPARVWAQVVGELGLNGASADIVPLPIRPADPEPSSGATRGRRLRPAILTAAAAGLVGILIGVFGTLALDSRDEREPKVMASAELGPLPGKEGRASVAVQDTRDGLALRVRATGLPGARGFYEVWLLDPAAKRLISLGALPESGSASFPVPPGTDLSRYPVLDISLEPADGDPTHSSNSFVRGTLPA